jgi:hypothetical protein
VPGLRGLWLLIGGIATVFFILGGSLQIVSGLARHDVEEPLSFPPGITRVVVNSDAGYLEIRGGERDIIVGTRRTTSSIGGEPVVDQTITGDTLRIHARCGHWFIHGCAVSYTLEVPRSLSVEAHSSAGRVSVAGVDGAVDAQSEAGSVEAEDLGGGANLFSTAGGIRASGLRGATVTAESTAGDVDLGFAAAPTYVTARSTAGDVEVRVPDDGTAYRVRIDSPADVTDIRVPVDNGSDRVIGASTSAGDVSVLAGPS